jgi:hypothetical protein
MNLNLGEYQGRTNVLVLVSIVLLTVILLPPLDAIENANLTARMVEGTLMIVYSISLGYGVERLLRGNVPREGKRVDHWGRSILLGIILPGIVLTYWNFPVALDATFADIGLRYASYASYIAIGVLAGIAVPTMPTGLRAGILILTFLSVGMMGSMMLVWQPGFYTAYSPAQNLDSNTFLMGMGALGVLVSGSWTMKILGIV